MRTFITILSILFCLNANAASIVYYVSNAGNDANNGTSQATAWQTLDKVNAQMSTFAPGDNILFRRGDVFYGSLTIAQSGASGNPITFGAYGTGADPIITGFTTVTSWTSLGSNIWESTNAVSTLSYTNMVTIGGVNTPMGRIPNSGYYTYQSHSGNTTITSSNLTGTPNWTGAGVVIKRDRFNIKVGAVTSQSGGTLNYTDGSANTTQPTDGFGFFLQNDIRTLDLQNEWYYNPSTKKLSIYSTSSPTNVNVATVGTLLTIPNSVSYVTIDGIAFVGANSSALNVSTSGTGITIQNCDINFSGVNAITNYNSTYLLFQNNTVNYTNDDAIRLGNGATNASILNNTIKGSGIYPGMLTADWTMGAIASDVNYCTVQYNNLDSAGYNGIFASGINMKLRYNFINNACLIMDDGGGIYTSGGASGDGVGKEIIGNIILNTKGSAEGTSSPLDPMGQGIYLDSYSSGVLVKGNTVSGCGSAGGFFSNLDSTTIRDNTFYNNSTSNTGFNAQSEVQIQYICCQIVRSNKFYNNIMVPKRPDKDALFVYSVADDIAQFGTLDSNYYAKPLGGTAISTQMQSTITDRTLSNWQSYVGQDAHSSTTPKTITDVNDLRFEYNATASPKTVTLDANYIDVRNVSYNGTITLQPYTSAVLIKNGAIIPPIAPPITKFSIHGRYKVVSK